MELKKHIITFCLLLSVFKITAQDATLKRADAQFNKYAFVDAAKSYKKLIEKGEFVEHATRKLADCYALMRNPDAAVYYYEKSVRQDNVPIEYYYRYAQALRGTKDYKASRIWLEKFFSSGGKISKDKFSKDSEFLNTIFKAEHQYFLKDVNFNSKFSDFGAYENNGTLYFISSRDEGLAIKRKYGWNEEPFLDVYAVNKQDLDSVTVDNTYKVKGKVNSIFHDGPVSISKDGETMYFSRTNFINNNLSRDKMGISNLKIYRASLVDGKWTDIEELPFNSDSYSNGHPALNQDGSKLYFASNMPGGVGGTDLYYVDIHSDGSYGKPMNLGKTVNTQENERFPFINSEDTLFFASDGHHGLGLLDIFVAVTGDDGSFANVLNLGVPVNSSKDDFSFFMDENGTKGYFASNRDGGIGSDDIYAFNRLKSIKLEGTVYDAESGSPLANAIVELMDANGKQIETFKTNENGNYATNIDKDNDFVIKVTKDGYLDKTTQVTSKGLAPNINSITVDFAIQPVPEPKMQEPITDLGPIYFNFDSANIRISETTELDRIVDLMINKYPDMAIEIRSHSDSRGSEAYNLVLSQRRAKSTFDYLTENGIDPKRIVAYKGLGEQELVNGCDGTVSCSEKQHALNRRTNFIVIKVK
ncbi:OmpA family protein [Flavobacteriaceae bacterium GSB9]|nr:OmpA family protein [Flavobacteriaceae bacterium GSB9]